MADVRIHFQVAVFKAEYIIWILASVLRYPIYFLTVQLLITLKTNLVHTSALQVNSLNYNCQLSIIVGIFIL